MKKHRALAMVVAAGVLGAATFTVASVAIPAYASSSYPSVMNRTECMREVPNDACIGVAPAGDHVSMICWVGDGPNVLGSRKWFDVASQDGGGGFVPAPSVSNQTWSPWCGF